MSGQDLAAIDGDISVRQLIGWLVATWPRRVLIGMLVVVPLVVGLVGGFAPAPVRDLPDLPAGEPIAVGPYDLALETYFVSDQVHTRYLPEGAEAWLGLVLTARGTHTEAVSMNRQVTTFPEGLGIITLDEDVAHPNHSEVVRIDDGRLAARFAPGLDVQVVSLIAVSDAEAIPDEITVQITDLEPAWSFLLESETWYERERIGQVHLNRTGTVPPALVEEEEQEW